MKFRNCQRFKTAYRIIAVLLIQTFLVLECALAGVVFDKSQSAQATTTLSPQINLDFKLLQNTYRDLYNYSTLVNQSQSTGLPQNSEQSEQIFKIVKAQILDAIEDLNAKLLENYNFDTNAVFYKKYSADNPSQANFDMLADTEKYKGNFCLGLSMVLQRMIYKTLTSKAFLENIFPGKVSKVKIIKKHDDDLEYEIKFEIAGRPYKIKGYIVSSLATEPKLTSEESEYLEVMHFASMIKLVTPSGKEFPIVSDPAWAITKEIILDKKIELRGKQYFLKTPIQQDIHDYIDDNSGLSWMKDSKRGQKLIEQLEKNGIALIEQSGERYFIRYMFLDQPLEKEFINPWLHNYVAVAPSKEQKIVRIDKKANILAAVRINLNTEKEIQAKTEDPAIRITDESKSPLVMKLLYFNKDGKRRIKTLFLEDLEAIRKEIQDMGLVFEVLGSLGVNTDKDATLTSTENTMIFLETGRQLGLVKEHQLGQYADESEFFKRLTVLLDNRVEFLKSIEDKKLIEQQLQLGKSADKKVILYQSKYGGSMRGSVKAMFYKMKPDFIVLPEYLFIHRMIEKLDYHSAKRFLKKGVEVSSKYYQDFKILSEQLSTTIISGSLLEEAEQGSYYNTCYIFHKGEEVGKHRKMNLIDREVKMGLKAGNDLSAFEIDGVKIAVLLSSDIFDQQLEKKLKKLGHIDIIFLPTSTPLKHQNGGSASKSKFQLLRWVKENEIHLVKVGGVGNLLGENRRGRSRVFGPKGVFVKPVNDENEEIMVVDLNINKTKNHRRSSITNYKDNFLDFNTEDVINVFRKKNNITRKDEKIGIVRVTAENLEKIQIYFKNIGKDVKPEGENWHSKYWREKDNYYKYFVDQTKNNHFSEGIAVLVAISEKGIVEGFIGTAYAKDHKNNLGQASINCDDDTFYRSATQSAPWNLRPNGFDDRDNGVTLEHKAKFSGIGTDLSVALTNYAFKMRGNKRLEDDFIIRIGAATTWRGVEHAESITRYNPPDYGHIEMRKPFYLPVRSALKFNIYHLLKFYYKGLHSAEEIWGFSGLKKYGYPLEYVYNGKDGLLDEMFEDEKSENRIYKKKTENGYVFSVLGNKTDIYDVFFPQGIPTQIDGLKEWDDVFDEINEDIIKEENTVYYSDISSAFFTKNIPVKTGERILDFGTGSGILAIYAIKKGAGYVLAIDNNERSLDLARRNIDRFNVRSGIKLTKSNGYSQIKKGEKFSKIIFFSPVPPRDNKYSSNTQIHDPNDNIIKMFFLGTRERLFSQGKVILMYPDNPTSIEKIKKLALKNGLIMTNRVKWETDDRVRGFYRRNPFYKGSDAAEIDVIKEEMAENGDYFWSVFTFEKIEDYVKESTMRSEDFLLGAYIERCLEENAYSKTDDEKIEEITNILETVSIDKNLSSIIIQALRDRRKLSLRELVDYYIQNREKYGDSIFIETVKIVGVLMEAAAHRESKETNISLPRQTDEELALQKLMQQYPQIACTIGIEAEAFNATHDESFPLSYFTKERTNLTPRLLLPLLYKLVAFQKSGLNTQWHKTPIDGLFEINSVPSASWKAMANLIDLLIKKKVLIPPHLSPMHVNLGMLPANKQLLSTFLSAGYDDEMEQMLLIPVMFLAAPYVRFESGYFQKVGSWKSVAMKPVGDFKPSYRFELHFPVLDPSDPGSYMMPLKLQFFFMAFFASLRRRQQQPNIAITEFETKLADVYDVYRDKVTNFLHQYPVHKEVSITNIPSYRFMSSDKTHPLRTRKQRRESATELLRLFNETYNSLEEIIFDEMVSNGFIKRNDQEENEFESIRKQNSSEFETILDKTITLTRKALVKAADRLHAYKIRFGLIEPGAPRPKNPLSYESLYGYSDFMPHTITQVINSLLKEKRKFTWIRTHSTMRLFKTKAMHAFLVTNYEGKNYLIDPAFIEFFDPNRTQQDQIGYAGHLLREAVKDGRPNWLAFARELLEKGYIELTDDAANMYGSILSGKVDTDRVFTSKDFFIGSTLKGEQLLKQETEEYFTGLESILFLNDVDINLPVPAALDELLLPNSDIKSFLTKDQVEAKLKKYARAHFFEMQQAHFADYPVVCGKSSQTMANLLSSEFDFVPETKHTFPRIEFAMVKFKGEFGDQLWPSVWEMIAQGKETDLRNHVCLKLSLSSDEAYLIDAAANVYDKKYDGQIIFMPYEKGLKALGYSLVEVLPNIVAVHSFIANRSNIENRSEGEYSAMRDIVNGVLIDIISRQETAVAFYLRKALSQLKARKTKFINTIILKDYFYVAATDQEVIRVVDEIMATENIILQLSYPGKGAFMHMDKSFLERYRKAIWQGRMKVIVRNDSPDGQMGYISPALLDELLGIGSSRIYLYLKELFPSKEAHQISKMPFDKMLNKALECSI